MSNTIALDDWLEVVDDEYLSAFIREGGSAVKFAVTDEERRPALQQALKSRCDLSGFLFVSLDAISCRAHMPQDLFFEVARQIDWRLLCRKALLHILSKMSYKVEEVDASVPRGIVSAVATANGVDPDYVIQELRPDLERVVYRNAELARPFRSAMAHLCRLECFETAETDGYRGTPLLDWLTGRDNRIGHLRDFGVQTRIDRTTARLFLESTCRWVTEAGYLGTVILLDNSHVTVTPPRPRPPDGPRYYTKAMIMDHYEILREFIDTVDEMSGTLLVVSPAYEFLDDDVRGRGWGCYDALRTRVMDDVRDRELVNPASTLVRIA